jgi:hypothetical protein
MNNSFFALENATLSREPGVDIIPQLRERESELVNLIAALQGVSQTKEWSSLKEKYFDGLTADLKRRREVEASKDFPEPLKLAKLNGEIKWSERFSDLPKLEQTFRVELAAIKRRLHGTRINSD